MNINKFAGFIFIFLGCIALIYIGKTLLLPLAIATFIYFAILELKKIISKIRIGSFSIPESLQTFGAFGFIVLLLFVFGNLLYANISSISEVIPAYQSNINKLISRFGDLELINISLLTKEWINGDLIAKMVTIAVDSVSGLLSNSLLIFLYLVFIILESSLFSKKIRLMYKDDSSYNNVRFIMDNIARSMSRYISLKTVTSLGTGFFSFLVLTILNVDFAFFWAFLIFVLNYIPTIGSLVATIFPAVIALLQFGTFINPAIVLVSIGFIQFLVGNVIEPRLMGNSLNVSPLVVLVSLAFWGLLWGVTGMILSVPITIMLIIIMSQFESTQWIAILLSENGEILKKNTEH